MTSRSRHRDAAPPPGEGALYRWLFENTGPAAIVIDPDLTISMANIPADMMTGLKRTKIVGQHALDFVVPSERERLKLYHQMMIEGQIRSRRRIEFQVSNHKGRTRKVVAHVQVVPGTRRVVVSMLDVTRTGRIQQERRRLAAVIEQSAEAAVITDPHGQIVYVNRAFEYLSGFSREELIGQAVGAPAFAEYDRRIFNRMTFMVARDDSWSGRVKNIRRDGRTYIADTRIFPIFNPSGRVMNLVCIKMDVTAAVQLEIQLQQSQKMEAIGTLAGGIAHDFNNILGGILGFTELSLRQASGGDERLQHNLSRILDGCQRARELIHHILTFSRKQEESTQPLEMQLVVKEALKLLRASIPTTIEFRQQITPEPCIIRSTPTQVHQVVMNLCTNAAHAMAASGGTLDIRLEGVELAAGGPAALPPGAYVRLSVQDCGIGMDSRTLERIFEPYFTTKSESGGTGLGLSVVHGIVNDLGGGIQVASEPGRGSTFTVYFPRILKSVLLPAAELAGSPPGGQERILVVDDEVLILEIMREMLEALGYRIVTAGGGDEALMHLRRNPQGFDLVITDWVMPKMNGSQLARQIGSLCPLLPIILVTGTDMSGDQEQGSNLFQASLLKPIKFHDLAHTVRQVLDACQAANLPKPEGGSTGESAEKND